MCFTHHHSLYSPKTSLTQLMCKTNNNNTTVVNRFIFTSESLVILNHNVYGIKPSQQQNHEAIILNNKKSCYGRSHVKVFMKLAGFNNNTSTTMVGKLLISLITPEENKNDQVSGSSWSS